MKKILIATSALAFASSAFAADVSGYSLSAYKKSDGISSLYNETEVYFSGSKTLSNGISYGATYTIGFEGDSESSSSIFDPDGLDGGVDPAFAVVTAANEGDLKEAVKGVQASEDIIRNDYANINAYISSKYGKIEMGHHDSASAALGTSSIAAGKTIMNSVSYDLTNNVVDNAITLTSPLFYGAQVAYTMIPGDDVSNSMAARFATEVAGIDFAIAYGQSTTEVKYESVVPFKTSGAGLSMSKDGFSISYSMAKTDASIINTGAGTVADGELTDVRDEFLFPAFDSTRLGLGYDTEKFSVGYSYSTTLDADINDFYVGYNFMPNLTVFSELFTANDENELFVGTNITF